MNRKGGIMQKTEKKINKNNLKKVNKIQLSIKLNVCVSEIKKTNRW